MADLSKRLREMAVQRETVSPDEHGVRILSAILNRNKRLMAEAADALDARWQTTESAPRDGTPVLVWKIGQPVVRASVWRVRPNIQPEWEIHIVREGMGTPLEGFPVLTRLGDADAPTHWQPLPAPPEDV